MDGEPTPHRDGDTTLHLYAGGARGCGLGVHNLSGDSRRIPAQDANRLRFTAIRSFSAWPAAFIAKVARTIHHAHQRGVISRDLAPGNILIDAAGGSHVLDFGLARRMDADSFPTLAGWSFGNVGTAGVPAVAGVTPQRGRRGVRVGSHRIEKGSLSSVAFCALGLLVRADRFGDHRGHGGHATHAACFPRLP